MADTLLANLVKLGDMPVEQQAEFWDAILYSAEHQSEMNNFVNKKAIDANKTSITYFRTILPVIDKSSDRYKNGLIEGVTPAPEKMEIMELTADLIQNGWFYGFTDKALQHSYHDLTKVAKDSLANTMRSYNDEKIADTYFSSLNVADGIDITTYEGLLKLKGYLFTARAQTINGSYILMAPLEVLDLLLSKYSDRLTHTTEKNALIQGELGELAGFRLVPSRLQAFHTADNKLRYLAFGKNTRGEYPVTIAAYKLNENGQIIVKGLGELGNGDALNQRGSIGLKIDGEAFIMSDDSCAIHGVIDAARVYNEYDYDNKTSNKVRTSVSGVGFTANASYIELEVGKTFTLAVTSADGTDITTTATIAVDNTAIATYATKVVTAVKAGMTMLTIKSGDVTTYIPVKVTPKTPTAVTPATEDAGE